MAQKSCDLDKEEAEILQPSSCSPPNPSPSQPTATADTTNPLLSSSSSSSSPSLLLKPTEEFSIQRAERPESLDQVPCKLKAEKESEPLVKFTKRCSSCRKRVGLMGFRCRCGDLFCGQHRYSDTHDCSFDYKALGRQEISKANPVIRAAKIIKI